MQGAGTALWTGSRRSVVQISSFGGNLWRERTVTFGSRGRRPEVASTANAQPLPIPAAGAPAAPGNSRKSAGEGAAPEAPGNSPSSCCPRRPSNQNGRQSRDARQGPPPPAPGRHAPARGAAPEAAPVAGPPQFYAPQPRRVAAARVAAVRPRVAGAAPDLCLALLHCVRLSSLLPC